MRLFPSPKNHIMRDVLIDSFIQPEIKWNVGSGQHLENSIRIYSIRPYKKRSYKKHWWDLTNFKKKGEELVFFLLKILKRSGWTKPHLWDLALILIRRDWVLHCTQPISPSFSICGHQRVYSNLFRINLGIILNLQMSPILQTIETVWCLICEHSIMKCL